MWQLASESLSRFPEVVVTALSSEGYPVSVRQRSPRYDAETGEMPVLMPASVAPVAGPANVLAHYHDEDLWNLRIVRIKGRLERREGACPAASEADLKETARLVEAEGRPCLMEIADVRNSDALEAVLADGVERFGGRLDVVVANAGISNWARFWEMSDEQWQTMIDINLTGVWRTMKAAVPHMLSAGNGGSIITISSVAGIKALPSQSHYTAAKHGVVGLTKSAAIELGEYNIRVNSIHPWGVATAPAQEDPNVEKMLTAHPNYIMSFGCVLPTPFPAHVDDISDAVIYLASDLSRAVTATQLTVDMGATKV